MKAVRFHEHGGPDVLRYEEAPDPVPRPGDALVRVRACALNHLDPWQRRGMERVRIPLPHISGSDVAGELTDGRGVDVVVEHVGQATWDRSVRCLARCGRLVTCGATTGPQAGIDLRVRFGRQLSLLGSYMGRKGELLDAARFFLSGRLRPAIDRGYPLQEAAAAQARHEAAGQFGKIVLEIQ